MVLETLQQELNKEMQNEVVNTERVAYLEGRIKTINEATIETLNETNLGEPAEFTPEVPESIGEDITQFSAAMEVGTVEEDIV
jgi:hypothetical protein